MRTGLDIREEIETDVRHSPFFVPSLGWLCVIKCTPVQPPFRLASVSPSKAFLSKREPCPPSLKIGLQPPVASAARDPSFPSPNSPAPAPDSIHTSPSTVSSKTGRNPSNTLTAPRHPRTTNPLQNPRPRPPITMHIVPRRHRRYRESTKPPTRPTGPRFHVQSPSLISTS